MQATKTGGKSCKTDQLFQWLKNISAQVEALFLDFKPKRFSNSFGAIGGILAGSGAMKFTIFSCTLYLMTKNHHKNERVKQWEASCGSMAIQFEKWNKMGTWSCDFWRHDDQQSFSFLLEISLNCIKQLLQRFLWVLVFYSKKEMCRTKEITMNGRPTCRWWVKCFEKFF